MKQSKIDSALIALKEYQGHISAGSFNGKIRQEIDRRIGVPFTLFSFAVNEGIFKRIDRGVYSVLIKQIDPIHVRRILEAIKADAGERAKEKRNSNKVKTEVVKSDSGKENKPSNNFIEWDFAINKVTEPFAKELLTSGKGYSVGDILNSLKKEYKLTPRNK